MTVTYSSICRSRTKKGFWHPNLQRKRTSVNIVPAVWARKQMHPHPHDRLINHSPCSCLSGNASACTLGTVRSAKSHIILQMPACEHKHCGDAALEKEVVGLLAYVKWCMWKRKIWQVWIWVWFLLCYMQFIQLSIKEDFCDFCGNSD